MTAPKPGAVKRDRDVRLKIAKLHAEGKTTRQIALELGKYENHVRQALRAMGLMAHPNPKRNYDWHYPVLPACPKCGLRGEHVCTLPVWAVASHRPGPGYLG